MFWGARRASYALPLAKCVTSPMLKFRVPTSDAIENVLMKFAI